LDDKSQYWLELAEYDLETAHAMLETKRYLYVGFMCHQVIEKALKSLLAQTGTPPYIHSLSKLAELSNLYCQFDDEQKNIIDSLEPLNIQARYPEEKEQIFRSLSAERCSKLLSNTERLYQWIKNTL